jgi:hypothetical protein
VAAEAEARWRQQRKCGGSGGGGSLAAVAAAAAWRRLSYAQLQVLLGFLYLNADLRSILGLLFYYQLHSSPIHPSEIGHFDQNNN